LAQLSGVGGGYAAESVFDDPTQVRMLEQLASSSMPIGSMMLGPAMSAEDLIGMIQSGNWGPSPRLAATGPVDIPDTARLGPYFGIVPQLRRRLRLLDLIPSAAMEGRSFDYTQESGSFDTAAETPELAIKPEASVGLIDAQVVARTIAHWSKLKRQQLADVPALATTVQTRLTYGVLRRLENQIVGGDGSGENLRGILHTTGVAAPVVDASDNSVDKVLDGIRDILLAEATPSAVVLNPADYAGMLKLRSGAADGSWKGEYLGVGPFAASASALWDVPIVPSTAMSSGKVLIGDFAQATVFVREGVNVRVSDSDQDDFVRNRVSILCEGRFGFAIWQPTAFALVDLTP